MSKFLKVGTNGGAVYLDIAKIETAEFNAGRLLVRVNGIIITIDCDNAFGMLEWLDTNSEALPGDEVASEQDEQWRNEEAAKLRLTYSY